MRNRLHWHSCFECGDLWGHEDPECEELMIRDLDCPGHEEPRHTGAALKGEFGYDDTPPPYWHGTPPYRRVTAR